MWQTIKSWFSWESKESKVEPPSPIPDKKPNPPDLKQTVSSSLEIRKKPNSKNLHLRSRSQNSPTPSKTLSEKAKDKVLAPIQKIADMDTEASIKSGVKMIISAGAKHLIHEGKVFTVKAYEEKFGPLTDGQKMMVDLGTKYGGKIISDAVAEEVTNKIIKEVVAKYGTEIFTQSATLQTLGTLNQYYQAFMIGYNAGKTADYVVEQLTGKAISERLAISMAHTYVCCTDAKYRENYLNSMTIKLTAPEIALVTKTPVIGMIPWR